MQDIDHLLQRLEDAADSAEKLQRLLRRMKQKTELSQMLYQQEEAERSLRLGTDILSALQDVLAEGCADIGDGEQVYNAQRALCVDVCYESPYIFRCSMPNLPITKTKAAAAGYAALCSRELWDKLILTQPMGFRPFARAYVVYIHYDVADAKRAAYYDNDNLAIKALLDVVMPVVCCDDAAPLCDNLYFYVSGHQPHTELWVVERHHLSQWASLHPELPMLEDLREFYAK